MSQHNITIKGGTSARLVTAGKYCDRDIIVTATGSEGGGTTDVVITDDGKGNVLISGTSLSSDDNGNVEMGG